jgi:glyoxylase-like metal-dependent hydrolase (beta-lactamase superfamily II)
VSWDEVGDRCWVGRYREWDVNVGVVAGADGLLVIDTRGTLRQGLELLDDVRRLSPAPIRYVLNTHVHFDHTFGNKAFADAGSTIHAHENVVAAMAGQAESQDDGSPIVPASETFAVARVLDLGDRQVELLHLGNGHTDGDVVAVLADAEVVYAGDLVEESAHPSYGDDSFPLDWPDTADRLAGLLGERSRVVPGHGAVVDREFVESQKGDLGTVANTIAGLHHNGVSLTDALRHAEDWPYPLEDLENAIRRGYDQLGGTRRTLPLIG